VQAKVLRDGEPVCVSAEALVPGDVVLLASGDRVVADARLIEDEALEVDEAALTGESLPVAKAVDAPSESDRVVLEGSDVTVGSGKAVVVAVGAGTRLGATAAALALDETRESPLGRRLGHLFHSGITTVTGVLVAGVPTSSIPSRSSALRSALPASSAPSGNTAAVRTPRRAAPMAFSAPPPGERSSSVANSS